MFLLCHLFTGLMAGLLLYKMSGNKSFLAACAIGAILPDLIDKPIGHILFEGMLDNGRLVAHGLLFLGIVIAFGAVWQRTRGSWVIFGIALGVALHQLADAMFLDQVGWFWPIYGPFLSDDFNNYFGRSIISELGSFYEWAFGAFSLAIIIRYWPTRFGGRMWDFVTSRRYVLTNGSLALFLVAVTFCALGLIAWSSNEGNDVSGSWYIASMSASFATIALEMPQRKE